MVSVTVHVLRLTTLRMASTKEETGQIRKGEGLIDRKLFPINSRFLNLGHGFCLCSPTPKVIFLVAPLYHLLPFLLSGHSKAELAWVFVLATS
ncbi:hypothetical protein TNCV_405611 [Trichonephila clavipes]|nr:hypothetical protein TNCV_405611 [Trichonephila clavipes]